MLPHEYLKKPYGRFVVPESDGSFRAEIIEFPGCLAVGDTAAEALATLEEVAGSWLEVTLAKGQKIPPPIENVTFSGKLLVRLPKSLHKKASHLAMREGVSLNQFIVTSIAEQVGTRAVAQSHPMQVFMPVNFVVASMPNLAAYRQKQVSSVMGGGSMLGYLQFNQTNEDSYAGS